MRKDRGLPQSSMQDHAGKENRAFLCFPYRIAEQSVF